jgi:hypothetical protein
MKAARLAVPGLRMDSAAFLVLALLSPPATSLAAEEQQARREAVSKAGRVNVLYAPLLSPGRDK